MLLKTEQCVCVCHLQSKLKNILSIKRYITSSKNSKCSELKTYISELH